ncbi:unnamed protein product [Phyllotreta striolata]|uniref:CHK kinase-like domain-containing protein n=1 Tax=Phyllotreta striolata TaxID=444603 RepID=A0A9N9XJJ2_PHYSR|nr:unnamed protein product [Phyllotreta striolata]
MTDDVLTEEQIGKIFTKWSRNKNMSFISSSIAPLSNQLEGLIGEQYFLTITYEDDNKTSHVRFFVKIISRENPVMYNIAREATMFEKEAFFYNSFIPALKSFNFKCDYVADSYFCESSAVVLEDLSEKAYKGFGKSGSLNLDHCKICLKTLARFHADGILYQILKSKESSKEYSLTQDLPDIFEESLLEKQSSLYKYYTNSSKGLIRLANLLLENGTVEYFSKSLLEKIQYLIGNDCINNNFKLTITHNDLWTNNFLYQYDENNLVKACKIIDFQTISLKPPAYDVLTFLFLNTRRKFRDEYLTQLLDFYYQCMSEFVEERDFDANDVFSKEEFYSSCDYLTVYAKIHSAVDRSITLIPEEMFLKSAASDESFSNFLFEGRPEYMLESFNTCELFKEIMTEDIVELESLLAAK